MVAKWCWNSQSFRSRFRSRLNKRFLSNRWSVSKTTTNVDSLFGLVYWNHSNNHLTISINYQHFSLLQKSVDEMKKKLSTAHTVDWQRHHNKIINFDLKSFHILIGKFFIFCILSFYLLRRNKCVNKIHLEFKHFNNMWVYFRFPGTVKKGVKKKKTEHAIWRHFSAS